MQKADKLNEVCGTFCWVNVVASVLCPGPALLFNYNAFSLTLNKQCFTLGFTTAIYLGMNKSTWNSTMFFKTT